MNDSLSTPEKRLRLAVHLAEGVPLVNRLLGLRIPAPAFAHWQPAVLAEPDKQSADQAYAQLFGALFDTPVTDEASWWPLLARLRGMLDDTLQQDPLPATFPYVLQTADHSQEALVERLKDTLTVTRVDFPAVFERPGFVYVKINHYHWEYISHLAMEAHFREVFRRLRHDDIREWQASGIDELLIQAMRRQQQALQRQGHGDGVFDTAGFSLGIGFNNGDGYVSDDLVTPILPVYWPLYRGAMTGSYAFFKGLFPAAHYRFSDGALPKMIVWENRTREFYDCITRRVDAVVFIVPDPLREIFIRHWQGTTEVIVVPATRVHELWPAVMPVVAAQLADIFRRHRKVCILAQAGLMSVPIGIVVDRMRAEFPSTDVFFFDMGQALDIALYPDHPSGQWLRHPEIREVLNNAGEIPIALPPLAPP